MQKSPREPQRNTHITNFGGNVSFTPKHIYIPRSKEEVIKILNKHSNGQIRVRASLHSWSDVAISYDVIIDLRYFNKVEIVKEKDNQIFAVAGGGTILKDLVDYIEANSNTTIPTLGGLKRQTIAGAISTATHGSGRSSLSHYIEEMQIAAYDPKTGQAKIYGYKDGLKLRAARCAVGCMGIILSVKFCCIPKYWIQETVVRRQKLADILSQEKKFPLQQFALFPYLWEYFVYQRQIISRQPKWQLKWLMYMYRIYDYISVEILSHLILKVLVTLSSARRGCSKIIPWFYKTFIPKFMTTQTVLSDSTTGLTLHTLHHDTFRHLEMEVFIPSINIHKAVELIRHITSVFACLSDNIPGNIASQLRRVGMLEKLMENKGRYTHHYPLFFRHVLPDDTLISTTSGSKPYYAIGFFTYLAPDKREEFYNYAEFIARILTFLCDARLHWGKYYPLSNHDIKHLYPHLGEFYQICQSVDPNGVFRNDYTKRVLGFI